ncbi:MAG: carboxypeptidase-like regulatory domain-containing protein [Bacteroidales bacterium]|nr:carboxypeptidase-like regulatory domain-containing protein [Bacteroidales bacterium]
MKKLATTKRKFLKNFSKAFALSFIAFAFQACYGTPRDMYDDVHIYGTVTSTATNAPIKGIRVSIVSDNISDITDDNGRFSIYAYEIMQSYAIRFEDSDFGKDGAFMQKDTVVQRDTLNYSREIPLNVSLNAKPIHRISF